MNTGWMSGGCLVSADSQRRATLHGAPLDTRFTHSCLEWVDDVREQSADAFDWELKDIDAFGTAPKPSFRWKRIGDTILGQLEFGADIRSTFRVPDGSVIIQTPVSGVAELWLGQEYMVLAPGHATAASGTDQLSMSLTAEGRLFILQVERSVLEGVLVEMIGEPVNEPLRLDHSMHLHRGKGASLRLAWRLLADQVWRDSALVEDQWMALQWERVLLMMLLRIQPHNYTSRAMVATDADLRRRAASGLRVMSTPPAYVDRVLRIITEHPEWDHTTESLAQYAAVSARTLQSHFKRHLGVSPKVQVRNTRLDRVRDTLLSTSHWDATVERVMRKYGFRHYGRFARYYQQRFGERPAETLRRSRGRR